MKKKLSDIKIKEIIEKGITIHEEKVPHYSSLVKVYGSALQGVDATTITIEVNSSGGAFGFVIVGLPDKAVSESKQRVVTALRNNKYAVPKGNITVNLAPADLKKEGSSYDLPIALGILAASRQLNKENLHEYLIMGELSLDGTLQSITGALPIAIQARKEGYKGFILPVQNAAEAAIVSDLNVIPIENLKEAVEFLNGNHHIEPLVKDTRNIFFQALNHPDMDFEDVKGQEGIKRALEVAAAGGHNVILVGPPGAGKTMLARRIPGILPPLTLHEALETTKIHSVAGRLKGEVSLIAQRPFQAPHHTISDVALVGGGSNPKPGAISLSHNGVLFLDELPEFKRAVLEVLRQPIEERKVMVSRARLSVEFPANFMLIASMNPCPCGFFNHPEKDCLCNPGQVHRYLSKISGPLLDRIDLHVEVTPVNFDKLSSRAPAEKSKDIRERVMKARALQTERFKKYPGIYSNAMMPSNLVRKICPIDKEGETLLKLAMEKLGLSARAFDRIIKVARTIADLEGSKKIESIYVAEAIQYRSLDREAWGG